MAHLIAPINVAGTYLCCDPATKRTAAVLGGMAAPTGASEWEIYRAQQGGGQVEGSVSFGVCCGTAVDIVLTGRIETLDAGFDSIEVLHNGVQVFYHESADTSSDPNATVAAGPFTVTITLDDRPCGHEIQIRGSTGDDRANNDVWWRASAAVR
jgi:hypothetical protein